MRTKNEINISKYRISFVLTSASFAISSSVRVFSTFLTTFMNFSGVSFHSPSAERVFVAFSLIVALYK